MLIYKKKHVSLHSLYLYVCLFVLHCIQKYVGHDWKAIVTQL